MMNFEFYNKKHLGSQQTADKYLPLNRVENMLWVVVEVGNTDRVLLDLSLC